MNNQAERDDLRYLRVSRRAMLRASLGASALLTAAACGAKDSDVFAGAIAEPVPETTTTTTTRTSSTTTTSAPAASQTLDSDADAEVARAASSSGVAVAGEMVVAFTYMRVGEGKVESPYVAVWVENQEGELLETVALFYQQRRRGARWLDHLDRWWDGDTARIAAGGANVTATISSATRPPGDYAVAWDGTVNGEPAPAGTYSIYVESAREDGPVSLTSTTVDLNGSPQALMLPDDGELSKASVRINA